MMLDVQTGYFDKQLDAIGLHVADIVIFPFFQEVECEIYFFLELKQFLESYLLDCPFDEVVISG